MMDDQAYGTNSPQLGLCDGGGGVPRRLQLGVQLVAGHVPWLQEVLLLHLLWAGAYRGRLGLYMIDEQSGWAAYV